MPANNRSLPVFRELVRCYQAFEQYSSSHIRSLGLTPAQFDIIATLGNTTGMSCKELGEKTLITKGTLTGVLDRLEERGLIRREPSPSDARSMIISLTAAGEAEFQRVFVPHLAHLDELLRGVPDGHLDDARRMLEDLKLTFHRGARTVAAQRGAA